MFKFRIDYKQGTECIESGDRKSFDDVLKHSIRVIISAFGPTKDETDESQNYVYKYKFKKFGLNITYTDTIEDMYNGKTDHAHVEVRDAKTGRTVLYDTKKPTSKGLESSELKKWMPIVQYLYKFACKTIEQPYIYGVNKAGEKENDRIQKYIPYIINNGLEIYTGLTAFCSEVYGYPERIISIGDSLVLLEYTQKNSGTLCAPHQYMIRDLNNKCELLYRIDTLETDSNDKSKTTKKIPFGYRTDLVAYKQGPWEDYFCNYVESVMLNKTAELIDNGPANNQLIIEKSGK